MWTTQAGVAHRVHSSQQQTQKIATASIRSKEQPSTPTLFRTVIKTPTDSSEEAFGGPPHRGVSIGARQAQRFRDKRYKVPTRRCVEARMEPLDSDRT
jgi:hypothetical protein